MSLVKSPWLLKHYLNIIETLDFDFVIKKIVIRIIHAYEPARYCANIRPFLCLLFVPVMIKSFLFYPKIRTFWSYLTFIKLSNEGWYKYKQIILLLLPTIYKEEIIFRGVVHYYRMSLTIIFKLHLPTAFYLPNIVRSEFL